jgi:hypothetical protein
VAVATNCCGSPKAIATFAGEILSDVIIAGVAVNVVEVEMLPEAAATAAVPRVRALAMPVLVTETIVGLDDDQTTELVRSRVLPSLSVAVAVNG